MFKNDDGFRFAIPKLRENTLLYMSNTFLEAFVKFETASN